MESTLLRKPEQYLYSLVCGALARNLLRVTLWIIKLFFVYFDVYLGSVDKATISFIFIMPLFAFLASMSGDFPTSRAGNVAHFSDQGTLANIATSIYLYIGHHNLCVCAYICGVQHPCSYPQVLNLGLQSCQLGDSYT